MKYLTKYKKFIKNYLLNKKAYQFIVKDWVKIKDLEIASQLLNTTRYSRNIAPILRGPIENKRILVIAPHPDDEIFGPGGTLIQSIRKGSCVSTLYLTTGSDYCADRMREEAKAVGKQVGYDTYFLEYRAGSLPIDQECIERFSKMVNEYSPDVVFIPFCLDDHDDHRRASHILLLADKMGLLKCDFQIWAYQVYTSIIPSVVVDITDVAQEKEAAIRIWESQMEKRDWVQFSLGLNAYNVRFLPYNKPGGYAETFFVLPLKGYLELCSGYFLDNPNLCYYNPAYLIE